MPNVILTASECEPGGLPMVCMACGQPAEVVRPKTFAYRPVDYPLLMIVGMVLALPLWDALGTEAATVALIGALIPLALTRRRRVWTPLCPDHVSYWVIRAWLRYGGTLAIVGSLAGAVLVGYMSTGLRDRTFRLSLIVWLVLVAVWMIAMTVLGQLSIRPFLIGDTIELLGVHADFVAALKRWRSADRNPPARGDTAGG